MSQLHADSKPFPLLLGVLVLLGCGSTRNLLSDRYDCAELSSLAHYRSIEVVFPGEKPRQVDDFYICPEYATWVDRESGKYVSVPVRSLAEIRVGGKDSLRGAGMSIGFIAGVAAGAGFAAVVRSQDATVPIRSGKQGPSLVLASGVVGAAAGLMHDLAGSSRYTVCMGCRE
jgi:hypothetical protein